MSKVLDFLNRDIKTFLPAKKIEQKTIGSKGSVMYDLLSHGHSSASDSYLLHLYDSSTAVSIPINYIADLFRGINPVIKSDDKIIRSHDVLALLKKPSPYFTKELFFEMMAKEYLICGSSYLVMIGNINFKPSELNPVSCTTTTVDHSGAYPLSIEVNGNVLTGSYKTRIIDQVARYFKDELTEIAQMRSYSTKNNSLVEGDSPLKSAVKEAEQHILGNKHNIKQLKKDGKLSQHFHFEDDMDTDQFDEQRARIRDEYGGTESDSIAVTSGERLKIEQFGVNNKDMDFAILQQMAMQSIAKAYKVPLPLLGVGSTFDNYKTSKIALYDDAILPLADNIFGFLTRILMPRFGLDPDEYKITYDVDDIEALKIRRQEEMTFRKNLGIENDNELREAIGKEKYPEGDTFYKPANLIPVGSDIFKEEDVL